jgi:phospholipid-binding lipoprotein MlaA
MRIVALVIFTVLGGCAAGNVQIRSVPAETPSADTTAAIKNEQVIAAAQQEQNEAVGPQVLPSDAPSMRTYDPWERMNRFTYRFNARFDETIFLPVANAYRQLPQPVQSGVHHFFFNLSEVDNVINFSLQGRLGYTAKSLGRFVINSTIGIAGLFDIANKLNLPPASTGFSGTLAKWGVHPGPFLVIPFLGPSTLRDGLGYVGDYGTSYAVNIGGLYRGDKSTLLGAANAIDQRAGIDFRYYATGSAFEYETIRFLYVRKRLIEDEALHADPNKSRSPKNGPAGQ